MIFALCFIGLFYCLTILKLYHGITRLSETNSLNTTPENHFSIIIPFRNEAKNLPTLLQTISCLQYPLSLFEIIFVDDDSTDASSEIIESHFLNFEELKDIQFKIIKNRRVSASPKKDAISVAISISKYNWILTTDADCELPKGWLKAYNQNIHTNNSKMICGPVIYTSYGNVISEFQQLDGFSLQGITMGSFGLKNPLLCNGANLGYRKDIFEALQGFDSNNHIASGDDVFMLEKVKYTFPNDVTFLKDKNAIVVTKPQQNWSTIIEQRVRWASKTSKQKGITSKLLGLLVFITNLFLILGFISCILHREIIPFYAFFFVLKVFSDYLFIKKSASFFTKKINNKSFLMSALLYPVIIQTVVLKSFIGNYTWKGRTFKKNP